MSKNLGKKLILIFTTWRMLLIIVGVLSVLILPLKLGFLGGGLNNYLNFPILWSLANFDGEHYLSIAKNGYFQYEQAFFPIYPLLIKYLANISSVNSLYIALILSNLSILISIIYFFRIARNINMSENKSVWSVIFLLVFPTSFYFGAVYTESLFLMFSTISFYYFLKKNYFIAGLMGMFASGTRIVGLALFVGYLMEILLPYDSLYNLFRKFNVKKINVSIVRLPNKLNLLWLCLIPIGLIIYMLWLQFVYNDALLFLHAQSFFGANRSGNSLVLFPQVMYRYMKILFLPIGYSSGFKVVWSQLNYQYFIAVVEILISIYFLVLIWFSIIKQRISFSIYSLILFFLPTLTGSLSSMPRYVLTIFPIFLLQAELFNNKVIRFAVMLIYIIFLVMFTTLFTRGYWIS